MINGSIRTKTVLPWVIQPKSNSKNTKQETIFRPAHHCNLTCATRLVLSKWGANMTSTFSEGYAKLRSQGYSVAQSRAAQGRSLANGRKSWLILLVLIGNVQVLQFRDEAGKKWGLQASPRGNDTFLNVAKGFLFLLMACVYLSSRAVA